MAVAQPSLHVELAPADPAGVDGAADPPVRVIARGEIDAATAPQLAESMDEAFARGTGAVALDFADITFVDSSGLRVIVALHRRAVDAGRSVVVVAASAAVRRIFEITGLTELLAD